MFDVQESESMNLISRKKPHFTIIPKLRKYLTKYSREQTLPIRYQDLRHFTQSTAVYDKDGNDTLWQSVMYSHADMEEIYNGLKEIYARLCVDGDMAVIEHLSVERVDFCTFGNSRPFRIRIVNNINDNFAHFYVKQADASRVYGLELEHILSPNKINFITDQDTLVEEHIAGIPGDVFINNLPKVRDINHIRIAKEFIKFNERCFVRLLGDMRSYNYVVDITPDFEENQYRIRCIDFDQQSYEGKKNMYLPQFFRENNKVVKFCIEHISKETVLQYQKEERVLIAKRLRSMRYRIKDLLDIMQMDQISTTDKVDQLKTELAAHHHDEGFLRCRNMGEVLKKNLKVTLLKPMRVISTADQTKLYNYLKRGNSIR